MNGEIVLPPIETFTREENVKDQARKVLEEAAELFVAVTDNRFDLSETVCEAMDTIQAICNLLEMMEVTDQQIEISYKDVVYKNKKRGYYDVR